MNSIKAFFGIIRATLGLIDTIISGIVSIILCLIASILYQWSAFVEPVAPSKRKEVKHKFKFRFERSIDSVTAAMNAFTDTLIKINKLNKEEES